MPDGEPWDAAPAVFANRLTSSAELSDRSRRQASELRVAHSGIVGSSLVGRARDRDAGAEHLRHDILGDLRGREAGILEDLLAAWRGR